MVSTACIGATRLLQPRLTLYQVVLAASICTRGGKAVLSRQFREMPRSRIEALLASFPKLADSGTQHTTVEQDNVRFVYQPLDELYMVLITNKQSNILQDIDSLHLFAQVVTSACRSLDEREILRNAYELLSAFDELVTLGYRDNLNITQIKTFLEMESHEERVQEIIARVRGQQSSCMKVTAANCYCRTRNSKPRKSASARPNSSRCSARSRPALVAWAVWAVVWVAAWAAPSLTTATRHLRRQMRRLHTKPRRQSLSKSA